MDTVKRFRTTTVVLTANGDVHTHEEQVFVHDLNLFVTVQLLEKTLAVLSLGKLCEDHGYSYEWVSGQKPWLSKNGKTINHLQKRTISYFLSFQGYPPILEAFRLLHHHHRTRREKKWKKASGNSWRSASSSSSSPVSEGSDKPAPRRWCGSSSEHPNQNKKRDDNRDSDDRSRDLHVDGLRSPQIILRTQNCMHPHTVLRTLIRNVPRKWYQNQGSTVFILTHQKTETAKSACEPKWRGLLAEDALAKLHLGQRNLVICLQPITKSSVKAVNLETIIDMLSWYKILATQWIQSFPCKTKISQETEKS